ncbi:MAG TPA: ABC transporter permease [Bryobacteraceae bacterium]|jgi:putative ABC transport system permease protein|nr:ABC transporter permease [Bryobacteraceae bacterium]
MNVLGDIKYAFRGLRKSLVFSISATLTLAVGIGPITAVFALVNTVLLRPLPYPQPDQIVTVHPRDTLGAPHESTLDYRTFFDFRAHNRVFEHLVSYRESAFTLTSPGPALQINGEIVSWDLFPLLRIQPKLGRGFRPDEETPGAHVAVLSYELWQSRFHSDRNVLGRSVIINGRPFRVVGVAPPGFRFPVESPEVGLWTTLAEDAVSDFEPLTTQNGARVLDAIARLKPGVSSSAAQAQLDSVAAVLAKQYPEQNGNISTTYVRSALDHLVGNGRKAIVIVLWAVALVLLIACANVSSLLLTRGTERRREFAVRTAIGASRGRLIRQLLFENLALCFLGSVTGILLTYLFLRVMLPFAGNSIPRLMDTDVDGRVFGFTFAVMLFTTILVGLAPSRDILKTDLSTFLKEGARGLVGNQDRVRRALIILQIAMGITLLSGAELLIADFVHLSSRNLGFQPDHLLTFNVSLSPHEYKTAQQVAFCDRLLEQLRTIPGVKSGVTATPLPLSGNKLPMSFEIEQHPTPGADRPQCDMAIVTPGYFAAMGIPLIGGRDFTVRDNASSSPVIIVNRAFAAKYFPRESAIGKRIEPGATNDNAGPSMHQIVGIVGDARQSAFNSDADPVYYLPYKQLSWSIGTIILRTSPQPLPLERAATAVVQSLDSRVPVYDIKTMDQLASLAIARPRFQTILMSTFAFMALFLTAIGLNGMLAYFVASRRREIAVRVALGAERRKIIRLVLKQAALCIAAGLALGILGTFSEQRLLENMLYGRAPGAFSSIVLASALLVCAGLLAVYIPVRRAATLDVMENLRSE